MDDTLWNSFQSSQQRGMELRRGGQWQEAREHLLKAASAGLALARGAETAEARDRFTKSVAQLLELARDCESAQREKREAPIAGSGKEGVMAGVNSPIARTPIHRPTHELFERYRDGGIAAWRRRDWQTAVMSFSRAAETIELLAAETVDSEQRDVRLETGRKLRERAAEAAGNAQGAVLKRAGVGGPSNAAAAPREAEGGGSAEQWMVRERPSLRFADVAGLEDVKQDIRVKMIYPFSHPELAAKFGIRGGGGVLLFGPPGTGKTMLAKATAGELDATFYRVTAADMLSKWVGEAEQNIKKLFDSAAADARAVIFIDEIEALIPARQDEGSGVMQRVVPQILQGMEGFDKKATQSVLFMGATNVPWQLDPAVLRPGRFDEKVYIPLPDAAARRKMIDIYLGGRPVAPDVDLDALAEKLEGYSGADIKYICDRAATIPFLHSVATGEQGLIDQRILDEVVSGVRKSVTAASLGRYEQWARGVGMGE